MNPLCFVCQEPATRVCKHSMCEQQPYFCSGRCNKNISQIVHTHNGQVNIISISQFQQRIRYLQFTIRNQLSPQYTNLINERIKTLKLQIQEMMKRHINDLTQQIKFQLDQYTQNIIESVVGMQGNLSGRKISELFNNIIKREETVFFETLSSIKNYFMKDLDHIENKVKKVLTYNKRVQISNILVQKAKNIGCFQLIKPISIMKTALKINNFNSYIYFSLAKLKQESNKIDAARQLYEKCVKLDQFSWKAWNNLGLIHMTSKNYQQALKCFTNSIKLQQVIDWQQNCYQNRAKCYVLLDEKDKAIDDYNYLVKNYPKQQYYSRLSDIYKQKINRKQYQLQQIDNQGAEWV